MYAATDGQYGIRKESLWTDDVSCFSCYDLIYSDDNEVDSGSCAPAEATIGPFGSYIAIGKAIWTGGTWTADGTPCEGSTTTARVGEILAHEWGHLEFELLDEREGSPSKNRCGFSLMAGTPSANFTTGNHHFEFCRDAEHGADAESGASPATGDSNWTDLIEEYSSLEEPAYSADFSRLAALGDFMTTSTFSSFSGP